MIITVKTKQQLSSVTARTSDIVYCIENNTYYTISPYDNRTFIESDTSVKTVVSIGSPTTSDNGEIGTIRVDKTANKIYIATDTDDTTTVWKDITSEVTHTNITQKDSGTYNDGGHTNLIPRVISTSNPTNTDSSYKIGTIWINTSSDTIFILVDNTENNAIWNEYNKKYQVISDEITLNNENMNVKIISLSSVTSNNIFTFQFMGNIQEYVIADIKLSVIEIVENTSVTIMAFTPNRYNGNITFKMVIN